MGASLGTRGGQDTLPGHEPTLQRHHKALNLGDRRDEPVFHAPRPGGRMGQTGDPGPTPDARIKAVGSVRGQWASRAARTQAPTWGGCLPVPRGWATPQAGQGGDGQSRGGPAAPQL